MGIMNFDVPMIDTIGSHVTYVSGVIFERLGNQVLVTRYLETTTNSTVMREIVGKDAKSIEALITDTDRAQSFLQELAANPVRGLARH